MSGGVYSPWGESPISAPGGGVPSRPAAGAASDSSASRAEGAPAGRDNGREARSGLRALPEDIPGIAAQGREVGITSATGAKPARDSGGLRVAGAVFPPSDPCGIVLDDFVAGVLAIVAAHDQLDPSAWLTRVICNAAGDIGLGFILDELKMKVAEADGDLRRVPDFERAAGSRFAKTDCSEVSSDGGER